jgi:ribosome-binding factor A
MSQRIAKVQSLLQQIVATELQSRLSDARMTVTGVDATPDLRQATVWLSVIAEEPKQTELFKAAQAELSGIQAATARHMTTKFVPKLSFQLDNGTQHANRIHRLISEL